jgi:hypothetical protein
MDDDDPYYTPAELARQEAQRSLQQSRRDLEERQARDAEDPDVLNAETDAFLANLKQQELPTDAERIELARLTREAVSIDRQPEPQDPHPQPATGGGFISYDYLSKAIEIIGEEVGAMLNDLEKTTQRRAAAAEEKMQRKLAEIEQEWRGRIGAIESRLQAIENKEAFGGY